MNEGMNEWMKEWMNEWMNEWVSEWMSEWMNEWRINVLTNESIIDGVTLLVFLWKGMNVTWTDSMNILCDTLDSWRH